MTSFAENMYKHASRASDGTGISTNVILAVWQHETGYGKSNLAKNHNNYGGIKWIDGRSQYQASKGPAGHASYDSISDFVNDFIRVMNLGYYNDVRNASTPHEAISAWHKSPYATDPKYGTKVLKHYQEIRTGTPVTETPDINIDNFVSSAESLEHDQLVKYGAIGLAVIGVANLIK